MSQIGYQPDAIFDIIIDLIANLHKFAEKNCNG